MMDKSSAPRVWSHEQAGKEPEANEVPEGTPRLSRCVMAKRSYPLSSMTMGGHHLHLWRRYQSSIASRSSTILARALINSAQVSLRIAPFLNQHFCHVNRVKARMSSLNHIITSSACIAASDAESVLTSGNCGILTRDIDEDRFIFTLCSS